MVESYPHYVITSFIFANMVIDLHRKTVIEMIISILMHFFDINSSFSKIYIVYVITDFYPTTKSEEYSFGVIRPSILSISPHFLCARNHISVLINQI